jgi:hypothetical protein
MMVSIIKVGRDSGAARSTVKKNETCLFIAILMLPAGLL